MKKTMLITVLVLLTILAVSCTESNYPNGSSGNAIVHNDAASGKTITRIAVTSVPTLSWGTSTYYNNRVSILPNSKSQIIEIELRSSNILGSRWNIFRVVVTLDDNSTAYKDIRVFEDIVNNLRFDGVNLVED